VEQLKLLAAQVGLQARPFMVGIDTCIDTGADRPRHDVHVGYTVFVLSSAQDLSLARHHSMREVVALPSVSHLLEGRLTHLFVEFTLQTGHGEPVALLLQVSSGLWLHAHLLGEVVRPVAVIVLLFPVCHWRFQFVAIHRDPCIDLWHLALACQQRATLTVALVGAVPSIV